MPSADKIVIFTGDTLKVQYESLQADPEDADSYNFNKTIAEVDSAFAQVWDVTNQAFLPIGGEDVFEAAADVDMNIVTYTLPGTFTVTSGSYKIFITAVYPDGQKVTDMRSFKVSPRT